MAFRTVDPRFPSLTFHCLVFYWIVCLATLGITIGSVVQQVGVYRADCDTNSSPYYYTSGYDDSSPYYDDISSDTECVPGDIVVLYVLYF